MFFCGSIASAVKHETSSKPRYPMNDTVPPARKPFIPSAGGRKGIRFPASSRPRPPSDIDATDATMSAVT